MNLPETRSTFYEYMGFNSILADRFELKLPLQSFLLQDDGMIHPGVFSTMLDISMGATVSLKTSSFAATMNLNVSFFDLNPKAVYHAETKILNWEGKYVTAEGCVCDQDGNVIAKGMGTFKTNPK
ncbi:PaaI family thioesterase [Bacillus sp. BRMEA1]|uniref:PaaI family thioesterase n=1 Tax=Neobacillus endophyticus TaxID=2738405 RepID=UPI001563068F|nr:PaaI family thioesterase [Neobacillus endophyticus]NRD79343.1 PaaI family thioesterase [Neobacillus endophyticus]